MSLTSQKVAVLLSSGAPVKIAVGEPKSLYLIVRAPQQGYWVGQFRDHTNGGKFQTKGLGRAPDVTLKAARDAWEADRAARRSAVPAVQVASAPKAKPIPAGKTFGEAAGEYIAAMATRWTGGAAGKTGRLYIADARTALAKLTLGELTDDAITAHTAAMTARAAKDTTVRIRAVRQFMIRGTIKEAEIVEHHKALPPADVPAFYKLLDLSKPAAKALAFTLLTAARIGDLTGNGANGKAPATWREISADGLWTIAGDKIEDREFVKGRSKSGKEHVVPLTPAALALLGPRGADDAPLFPALSYFQVYRYKQSLGLDFDIHGLRSTFRDWCGNNGIDRDLAEMALSHPAPGASESETAYARSSYLERRRPIMERWSVFVAGNL